MRCFRLCYRVGTEEDKTPSGGEGKEPLVHPTEVYCVILPILKFLYFLSVSSWPGHQPGPLLSWRRGRRVLASGDVAEKLLFLVFLLWRADVVFRWSSGVQSCKYGPVTEDTAVIVDVWLSCCLQIFM